MKKMRIMAALLCIMMVVCSLPVLQVSAAVGDLDADIAAILGADAAKVVYEQVVSTDFSGTDVYSGSTATTYEADGVKIGAGAQVWSVAPTQDFWTAKNAVVMKLKLGQDANDRLTIFTEAGTRKNVKKEAGEAQSRGKVMLADGVIYAGHKSLPGSMNDAFFRPGYDWLEVMVVHNDENFDVYVKNNPADSSACNTTNGKWVKLSFAEDLLYEQGHSGATKDEHFYIAQAASTDTVTYGSDETPAHLKSVKVYHGGRAVDSIAEVLQEGVAKSGATQGDTVVKVKTDNLYATSHDWNFANSTMETYYRDGNGSLAMPQGAKITAEGLDLSQTNGTDVWKYKPHNQWCFVNALRDGSVSFRAGYVKVKGDVTISFTGSTQNRLISVYSKPGVATTSGIDKKATSFVPDENWVEYIFIGRNSNSVNIWAKKGSDAVWTYCGQSGTTESLTDATPNRGLHFSGTGVVALWKTYDFNENGYSAGYPDTKMVATDSETIPATANTLVYGAEFDVVPSNAVLGKASSVANGVLDTKTTVANAELGTPNAEGTLKLDGLSIPVGGYAEFKAKGNGRIDAVFDDGVNMFSYNRLPADNYAIQGTAGAPFAHFVNDSDMAWRTYRVVRTADGYSFYSKAEGDTGWKIQGTAAEAKKAASDGNGAYVFFRFHTNCDGVSVGNGQLDYLRIYGTQADLEAMNGYTIESALGVAKSKNTYNVQVDANSGSRDDVAFHDSDSYVDGTYTADGLAFASGDKATLWGVKPTTNYWSVKNATVIKAKLGTENDVLNIYGNGVTEGSRFNYKIAKDQVHHQGGADITVIGWLNGDSTSATKQRFTPGTDWFELMIVAEANQQKFYGKNAQTNNVWSYLGTVPGYEERGVTMPIYAIGVSSDANAPTLLKSVMIYREDNGMTDPYFGGGGGGVPSAPVMDSIAKVIQDGVAKSGAEAGATVAKVKTDDLYATSHDWNFANSTMETYNRDGNGSLAMPQGAEITAEGLDLSQTNGEDEWKYMPHSNWSFVNAGAGSNTIFRAGYVKLKGNVTIKFTGSYHKRVNVVTSVPGSAMTTNEGETTKTHSFTPDNEWVEYIFVERNSNTANIYAKKATDKVWTHVGYTGTPTQLSNNDNGLKFSGTGVVALWKTIEFNESGYSASYPDTKVIATDSEIIPATANTLIYGAEFDVTPANAVLGKASSIANGVLDTKATVENAELGTPNAEGTLKIDGLSIPVGGYAEFKAKGNGKIDAVFDDGINKFSYNRLPADNYAIQGTAIGTLGNFVNDSDMAWRTYRVVRTAEGYSFYSKAEGDTGWKIQGTAAEASKKSSDGNGAYVFFRFHTNCDGVSVGNGQLDYLRIYGTQADLEAMNGYSIESALGVAKIKNTYNVQVDANSGSRDDVAFHPNVAYADGTYTADGVAFSSESHTLWGVKPTTNYWSVKNAIVVKAKLGTEDDILAIYGNSLTDGKRFNYKIAKDQINHQGSADVTVIGWLNGDSTSAKRQRFTPGTDWFELMVVVETDRQMFYGKNAQTNNVWSYLGTVNGYEANNAAMPVYAVAKSLDANAPTLVKSVMVYREDNGMTDPSFGGSEQPEQPSVPTYGSIAEVLREGVARSAGEQGATVAKVKTDDLYATSHDWNFANSTMETYNRGGNGSLAMPQGAKFTKEGLDLSQTNGEGEWRYLPHDQWCFVNALRNGTTSLRAGYVKVKGDVTIEFTGSEQKRLISVYSKPGVATTSGIDKKATTFVPDENWVEYIFVTRNSNTVNIWAKKESDTAWGFYGQSGTTELVTDVTPNRGLHFSGTGVVALWKTYDFNENGYNAAQPDTKMVATDAEVTPAGMDVLYFGEEFNSVPTYTTPQMVLGTASDIVDGVLKTNATPKNDALGTEATYGELRFKKLAIPEGGYAEFKVKANGAIEVVFDDSVTKFTMHRLPADNYSILGTKLAPFANFVNDSDAAWRTYRLIRSAEGYSLYSKAEGDNGWKIMGTADEASKLASDGNGAYIYFRFHTNCDGINEGNGELDYLRIYADQPFDDGSDDEEKPDVQEMDTIESALSSYVGNVTMTASSNAWKFANSTLKSYTRAGAIVSPSNAKFTDEGLDLSETNGTDAWRFTAFEGWSPASYGNTSTSYRALYVKVKGEVATTILMSDNQYIDKLRSVPGEKLSVSNAVGADGITKAYRTNDGFSGDPQIDDNWVEYLIIQRNSNATYVFAKSETLTDGKWVKAIGIDGYTYTPSSEAKAESYNEKNGTSLVYDAEVYANQRKTGISFSGTGVVAEWKTIDFNNATRETVASDADVTPEGADALWFVEEFTTAPAYNPAPAFGSACSLKDGTLLTNAKHGVDDDGVAATSGYVRFNDITIPVGGYAEFRMRSNGLKKLAFDDGVTRWETTLNCDYSAFPGTTALGGGYIADSDISWRTWRFVHTENGYSVYSKADGDTGWRIHSVDGINENAESKGATISIQFYPNADNVSDGNGQLDYLRVYGVAPDAPLAVVDGNNMTPIEDGAYLENPGYLRVVPGKGITSGKILVANYDGKILGNLQIVDIEDLNEETVLDVYSDYYNTVKIFLWDSLNGTMKNLSDVLNLTF